MSAAYLVRPNKRTLKAIEQRKREIYPGMNVVKGTTAIHVRHGDKGSEYPVAPESQYVSVLEDLYAKHAQQWGLTRNVFLSTEDDRTVEYFEGLPAWQVTYTRVDRYHNTSRSPMEHATKVGKSNELLNSLVSLDLALQCDAFVMTLSSNWCRLIDDLRATVRCKADRPFFDAQQDNSRPEDYNLYWRRS